MQVATSLLAVLACTIGRAEAEPGTGLVAGYPGYKQQKWKMAPRRAQARSLFYRETPKVENLQSSVHELYQRPYNYAYQSHSAVVVLSGESGVSGVIRFHQTGGPPSPVSVSGNVTGLSAGPHGFHIHQLGDTSGGCKSTGGHFNPLQLRHGAPGDLYRHVGDLGNILAGEDGVAVVKLEDTQLSLTGLASIVGRGVVVHAGMDDLGRGGDGGSLKTGNAGGRVACGVIGLAGAH